MTEYVPHPEWLLGPIPALIKMQKEKGKDVVLAFVEDAERAVPVRAYQVGLREWNRLLHDEVMRRLAGA